MHPARQEEEQGRVLGFVCSAAGEQRCPSKPTVANWSTEWLMAREAIEVIMIWLFRSYSLLVSINLSADSWTGACYLLELEALHLNI